MHQDGGALPWVKLCKAAHVRHPLLQLANGGRKPSHRGCAPATGHPHCVPPLLNHRCTMTPTPTIAIHMTAALAALALGPLAIWARRSATPRPALHRAAGHAWATMMLAAALSALFIRDFSLPNVWGYTPIHLFVPLTLAGMARAFVFLAQRNIEGHRKAMQGLYWQACVGAGLFTLLPGRYLGQLVWGQWLGWL